MPFGVGDMLLVIPDETTNTYKFDERKKPGDQDPFSPQIGVMNTTAPANQASVGVMAIWDGNEPTGDLLNVWNWFSVDVDAGKNVMAIWFPVASKWYVIAADC